MQIELLSSSLDIEKYLKNIGVDSGGISILSSKAEYFVIFLRDLHVGAANILKQDALSIGADLAVPRGTVIAKTPKVDCILIASKKALKILSKKELAQPFGLKEAALKFQEILRVQKPRKVEVMGVINTNEDSFFSGSRFQDKNAEAAIERMIEEGADIIDIGGVSSAPNSIYVGAEEELRRVKPIFDLVHGKKLYDRVKFSIDSYEPRVVSAALESGFKIVNDITGLSNPSICKLCAEYDATAVVMHMQNRPENMQENPHYEHILSDIYSFFELRVQEAEALGVRDIILDVGIGFGKTLEHNLILIKHHEHFLTLGKPMLVGASRKSMIDKLSPSSPENRVAGTLAIHLEAYKNGASIIRAHDVYEHVQALRVQQALDKI